ncbi:SCO2525 family SAM-dependent methyltransferase [Streptomyces sp. KM77-8]|uniref:SCO2525 family SAM-dependent methyltransferase n=1 Tax=Streptomyces haneummycinicus TaxID=3074435 RepID=A0AAT9HV60_9ACTN
MMDRNADAPWSQFDPEAYVDLNYRTPLEVDLLIVRLMRDYFSRCYAQGVPASVRGVDVGAGANLYPALSMLPWCEKILLLEYATPNVEYLERQASGGGYDTAWDAFWNELREAPPTGRSNPGAGSARSSGWNAPTCWTSTDSGAGTSARCSSSPTRCPSAPTSSRAASCASWTRSTGSPFAAAFMKESLGYQVGAHRYPAYRVNADRVRESLEPFTAELEIHDMDHMVRPGHEGMILALGRRNTAIATP